MHVKQAIPIVELFARVQVNGGKDYPATLKAKLLI